MLVTGMSLTPGRGRDLLKLGNSDSIQSLLGPKIIAERGGNEVFE